MNPPPLAYGAVGFPNGAVDLDRYCRLPAPTCLVLATEARWHGRELRARGKRVTWRVIPRVKFRPAELGWSPVAFVVEALDKTGEEGAAFDEFVPWNELDLGPERGDGDDDFQGLAARYSLIGGWALFVLNGLRQHLPAGTTLHFPAFTPDHSALDYVDSWRAAAEECDVVDLHAYGALEEIRACYQAYRQAFPDRRLRVTEWHCHGREDEEARVLAFLASLQDERDPGYDPLFEGADYFLWRWDGEHPSYDNSWTVEARPSREARFLELDTSGGGSMALPGRAELRPYGLAQAEANGVPVDMFDRQIQEESGWEHYNPDGSIKTSRSNARGVAQIVQRWHPNVNADDPWDSLRYAAKLMATNYAGRGSWKLALMDYNWGPGNVNAWIAAGSHDDQIRAQTTKYLNDILGPGWPEPGAAPAPPPQESPSMPQPSGPFEYNFGFKDIADRLGHDVVGAPTTPEEAFVPGDYTVQWTERGFMLYHKPTNRPYFFEGAR